MIILRPSEERGHIITDWLDTRHSFSFGEYFDPKYRGFRELRVINEDIIQPGKGFGMHEHRDMEIITYILTGSLQHKDSMGNGSIIHAGEVQYMSAGTRVLHSEFNPSLTEAVHLLQIWIFPDTKNLAPRYAQKDFSSSIQWGKLCPIINPQGNQGALSIHQDVTLFIGRFQDNQSITYDLQPGRYSWIQVTRGKIHILDQELTLGDGAAISDVNRFTITGLSTSEIILFDLP